MWSIKILLKNSKLNFDSIETATITHQGTKIANAQEEDVDEVELEWNWEAGVPHYPHPKYNDDDEVLFFPRIIGGTPAFHGEFLAKISLQTRRGHHFCGGSIIG